MPNVSGGGKPNLDIASSDWSRIEDAYGHSLSNEIRAEISAATQEFLCWASLEARAGPLADAEERIKSINAAANRLWEILDGGPKSLHPDAAFFARHLISKNFNDSRLDLPPSRSEVTSAALATADLGSSDSDFYRYATAKLGARKRDKLGFLSGLLSSLISACKLAKDELQGEDWGTWVKGKSWGAWMRRLASILASNGLPTGVGKGEATKSHFVALVRELQCCLPLKYRQHMPSESESAQGGLDGALAQGIYRARPSRKGHK